MAMVAGASPFVPAIDSYKSLNRWLPTVTLHNFPTSLRRSLQTQEDWMQEWFMPLVSHLQRAE